MSSALVGLKGGGRGSGGCGGGVGGGVLGTRVIDTTLLWNVLHVTPQLPQTFISTFFGNDEGQVKKETPSFTILPKSPRPRRSCFGPFHLRRATAHLVPPGRLLCLAGQLF